MPHTRDMTYSSPRWCRGAGRCDSPVCVGERGKDDRVQMRAYALMVTIALMGSARCPHCTAPVSMFEGEVDRTMTGCYRPSYVVMTCKPCNNALGQCALRDREGYVSAVVNASKGIEVPRKCDALRDYVKPPMEAQIASSPWA
jgi:hypothetical protein